MARLVPENHPALHTIAAEVTAEEFADGTIAKLVKDMKAALKEYSVEGFVAVAIAAPQIGVSKRIFLVEDQSNDRDSLPSFVAINPSLSKLSKKTSLVGEGCLSIPEAYGLVRRHKKATLKAVDADGRPYHIDAEGLIAQIVQHEVDHLDGILFTDRAEKVWHKDDLDTDNDKH